MENITRVKSLLIVCLMLGLLIAGQSWESANECYSECFNGCFQSISTPPNLCATSCAKQCRPNHNSLAAADSLDPLDPQHFCKVGCAISFCNNLGRKDDPAHQEAVANCVDKCSKKYCPKN